MFTCLKTTIITNHERRNEKRLLVVVFVVEDRLTPERLVTIAKGRAAVEHLFGRREAVLDIEKRTSAS
jgi:hypothetical protein